MCHAPAVLKNVTANDGTPLLAGKRVTGFTDEEEEAVGLTDIVPFLLEDILQQLGAKFNKAEPFKPHVVCEGRLITGPESGLEQADGRSLAGSAHQGNGERGHVVHFRIAQWLGARAPSPSLSRTGYRPESVESGLSRGWSVAADRWTTTHSLAASIDWTISARANTRGSLRNGSAGLGFGRRTIELTLSDGPRLR